MDYYGFYQGTARIVEISRFPYPLQVLHFRIFLSIDDPVDAAFAYFEGGQFLADFEAGVYFAQSQHLADEFFIVSQIGYRFVIQFISRLENLKQMKVKNLCEVIEVIDVSGREMFII